MIDHRINTMPIKHSLLAILVAAVWGANFIFVKMGVHEMPPLTLCAVRFFLASIPAVFFVKRPAAPFKMVALYGLIMFALQFSLMFSAFAAGMTAGMASLLGQTSVFFSIFFAAIFIREMPTIWQMIGALLSFSGIVLASLHIDNSTMTLTGFMFVIAAAAAWGLGTYITKRIGHVNMLSLVAWGSLISFPPLLIFSLFMEGPDRIIIATQHFSWVALISLLYITYVSTWVGYGAWGFLLSRYPVATVVPYTLLVPVFAMLTSTIFLGENFEPWKMAVSGLVIAGLCINFVVPRLIAKRKDAEMALTVSET